MKVNMNTVLMDINDEEQMKLQDGKVATLRAICQQALAGPVKGDDTLAEEKKYQMFRLGRRLKADDVHLTAPEVTLICERVSKFFVSSYVYGQVKDLLDPPPADEVAKPNGVDHHAN